MADYNTFVLYDCKSRKPIITTSSARKVAKQLDVGCRIEVWNNNKLVSKIYKSNETDLRPYIKAEKEYIRKKQERATLRNAKRREKLKRRKMATLNVSL